LAQGPSAVKGGDSFERGREGLNKARARDQQAFNLSGKVNRAYASSGAGSLAGAQESGKQEDFSPLLRPEREASGSVDKADASPEEESGKKQTTALGRAQSQSLSEAEKQLLAELEVVDRKVKAHEMAHLTAAGGYAKGGARFRYRHGPDGNKYAVGGEVSIDMGKESSPEKTIAKMRVVRRAALAPADPSPQDQRVAARATIYIAESTQELRLSEADSVTVIEQAAGKAGASVEEENQTVVNFTEKESRDSQSSGDSLSASRHPGSFYKSFDQAFGLKLKAASVDIFA
jgi:hypothetical protein